MKPVEEVVACVVDYGTFISVAEKLAETMKTVYYHSPYETEYQDVRDCVKGEGLDKAIRLDELLDPATLDRIDLFVFPDIGFGPLQRLLQKMGKAIWGHMGATDLELYRDLFLDTLKNVGLPTIHSEELIGVSALANYLKKNDNKWIKINRFRGNMETWHHENFEQSARMLDSLAVVFGGVKEYITFLAQDDIKSDMEVGYDGWCIDGQFPSHSFQGYEKKNELYLGSWLADKDLPDEIKVVNKAMAPILANYGYKNWWATEIRVSDGIPYFIDPTPRMPGQTGEHQLESIANLADVIWHGANGVMIEAKVRWKFAAEATLHYDIESVDSAIGSEWASLRIPKEAERWVKLYHYCKLGDLHHFPMDSTDEIGVVIGGGNTVQGAIDDLGEHLELLKGLPVHANATGFASLLGSIKEAEEQGITFGGKVPEPAVALKKL